MIVLLHIVLLIVILAVLDSLLDGPGSGNVPKKGPEPRPPKNVRPAEHIPDYGRVDRRAESESGPAETSQKASGKTVLEDQQ